MLKNTSFPLTLIAVAVMAGCAAVPTPSLNEAHSSYNSARTNPEVTNQAQLELKDASDSLNKADFALNDGEDDETVNHFAYLAKQQVGIAQETAKRKTAEIAVTNAAAQRNLVRLDARTAEADAAKQQAANAQKTVNEQATQLAVAGANAERDQALIAAQEQLLKDLNAKQTERGLVVTLSDVLFRTGKAQLKSGGVRDVNKVADFLNQYPKYKVLVEGHTDSVGTDENNQELSERRANSVRNAFIDTGISSDRVNARGYGEGFPVADNDTNGGRQLNRRVEIVLSDREGNIAPR
ncbi:MAG: OmpA family protein [Methylococcales bacterium]|nr:OmpA family protein [Methylococcaceae bacterium]